MARKKRQRPKGQPVSALERKQHVQTSSKENPFEYRYSNKKHDILGRKVKGEKGHQGQSRSRAAELRTKTLLVDYKNRNKANVFVDKRFGENDKNMTEEEKMMMRFAFQKQKNHHRAGMFNLNDDDNGDVMLTHKGRSIAEIDDFDDRDLRLSGEEEEDEEGMDASVVDQYHFGGFQRAEKSALDDKGEANQKRSHREIMAEVVETSKAHKYMRKMEREKAVDLTETLDRDFRQIIPLLDVRNKNIPSQPKLVNEDDEDDYDNAVMSMKFDIKAQATDRRKTPEEIAWAEYERLRKLEADRLRRMSGEKAGQVYESVEDLEGNVRAPDQRETLAYKEGRMLINGQEVQSDAKEDKDDDVEQLSDQPQSVTDSQSDEEEEESAESDEYTSDLELDEKANETKPELPEQRISNTDRGDGGSQEKEMERELPFIIKAPANLTEWLSLVKGRTPEEVVVIAQRVRTANHVKLKESNKETIMKFHDILLEYMIMTCQEHRPEIANGLAPVLHQLTQDVPGHSAVWARKEIGDIVANLSAEGSSKSALDLRTVLVLLITEMLWPTSDYRHPVSTPAGLAIGEILSYAPMNDVGSLAAGLFVGHLAQEFVRESNRVYPEGLSFVISVVDVFATANDSKPRPPDVDSATQTLPTLSKIPFELLKFQGKEADIEPIKLSRLINAPKLKITDSIRAGLLHNALLQLQQWVDIYKDIGCLDSALGPAVYHIKRLPAKLPPALSELAAETEKKISAAIGQAVANRVHLRLQKRAPVPLKQYTPRFEEKFIAGRVTDPDKERREKKKAIHVVKRELKHAKRELQKDAQFLAREKLKERLEADQERKDKVKSIFSMLADQQAESNHLKAFKSKMKRKRRD